MVNERRQDRGDRDRRRAAMNISVPVKENGDETALARSLALVRRPRIIVAIVGVLLAIAVVAFFAGRAVAPTRTGELPSPALAPAPSAAVVHVGTTAAAALPALRPVAHKARPSRPAHSTTTVRSTPRTTPHTATQPVAPAKSPPATPGYTIVGG